MRAKIYINNVLIDVSDELNLAFTYNIADIREPESRQANFSKTINIPASKTNNNLFTSIFEVSKTIIYTPDAPPKINFSPDFNPNKKARATVTVDDLQVMSGYCQMLKVIKSNGYVQGYEIVIISDNKNLVETFGNDYLSAISEEIDVYNHTYTGTVRVESWDTNIYKNGSPYVNFVAGLPIGEGYVYPSNLKYYKDPQPVGDPNNAMTQNDLPAIYLKTYIDSIFAHYGFSYTSNFFTGQYFKNLIVPSTRSKGSLDPDQLAKVYFKSVDGAVNGVFPDNTGSAVNKVLVFQTDVNDQDNVYDNGTGIYKVNTSFTGSIKADITFNVLINIDYGGVNPINSSNAIITVVHRLKKGSTVLDSDTTIFNTGAIPGFNANSTPVDLAAQTLVASFTHNLTTSNTFYSGDEYYIETSVNTTGSFYNGVTPVNDYNIEMSYAPFTQEFYNEVNNSNPVSGSTLTLSSLLPDNITVRDFFTGIVRTFNLYVEPDPNNPFNFYIEPYVNYYNSAIKKDWTNKIDVNNVEVIPSSNLNVRKYKFTFKPDQDILNTNYSNKNLETYGDYAYSIDNDFCSEEKTIESIFSPTPLATTYSSGNFYECIFFNDKEENRNSNIRLLIYGGVRSDGGGSYCYAGEVDDPVSPTEAARFDLAPNELFYYTDTLTNSTLFNKFWSKYLQEITDKDTKIITAFFDLTPLDIANFRFNDNIWIEDNYFRVNKIIDYNPLSEGLTKVELLKVKYYNGYQTENVRIAGTPQSFNVVEGGLDEVRDVGATSFYNLVEGGENEIRDVGATSPDNLINGGQNKI